MSLDSRYLREPGPRRAGNQVQGGKAKAQAQFCGLTWRTWRVRGLEARPLTGLFDSGCRRAAAGAEKRTAAAALRLEMARGAFFGADARFSGSIARLAIVDASLSIFVWDIVMYFSGHL